MYSKQIFAKNLKRLMEENGKTRRDVCEALGFSYYTFTDWVTGKKFPRIDRIEALEDYFHCDKSDLLEEKLTEEKEKDNDAITDAIVRMRVDREFMSTVEAMMKDAELLSAFSSMAEQDTEKRRALVETLKALCK